MRVFALLLVLASTSASTSALAQNEPTVVVTEPDKVVYKKTTALTFTEANVDGGIAKPSMTAIYARPKVKFRNLIELRSSFRPELAKSRDKL